MKRKIVTLLVALLLLASVCTCAAESEILGGEFTDMANTSTEDVVLRFDAAWHDGEGSVCDLNVLLPDQLTVDTDIAIFKFVVEGNNPPARYFPDETQRQIAEIVGEDAVDALYMTEFMRMHAVMSEVHGDVGTSMLVNVDYRPGETVLVVLADTSDPDNLVWTALPAEVTALCQIEFVIPEELMKQFMGEDLIYSLLTLSPGKARYRKDEETRPVERPLPSIGIENTVEVISVTTISGFEDARTFELAIVRETSEQVQELNSLREYVMEEGRSVVSWFPKQVQNEIDLLLDDSVDIDALVIYDYLSIYSIDYTDTFGDVLVTFSFATPYQEGDKIVTVLGLPHAKQGVGTQMDWNVQIARVESEGVVNIAFGQMQLIEMLEEPGLLMLLVERRLP